MESSDALPIGIQWVGFILSVISAGGVLLVLPTLLQLIFGGPRLVEEFANHDDDESNRMLVVFIKNEPVNKPFGKFSLVKRDTVTSFSATFRIVNIDNGAIVVPVHQAPIHSGDEDDDGLRKYRIALPPTISVGASIGVATWYALTGSPMIPPTRGKPPVPLAPAKYQAQIIFGVDGRRHDVAKNFVVGETREDLMWQ